MAGFSSIAATAIQALNTANTVVSAYKSYGDNSGVREYEQERAMNNLEMQQATANAAFAKDKIKADAAFAEEKRRNALRKIIGEKKAKYGGTGTGSADGSGQALLLGLFDESEDKREEAAAMDSFRFSEIDQDLANKQRINTLQLAQLKERNKLKKAGSLLDSITSVF